MFWSSADAMSKDPIKNICYIISTCSTQFIADPMKHVYKWWIVIPQFTFIQRTTNIIGHCILSVQLTPTLCARPFQSGYVFHDFCKMILKCLASLIFQMVHFHRVFSFVFRFSLTGAFLWFSIKASFISFFYLCRKDFELVPKLIKDTFFSKTGCAELLSEAN